MKKALAILLVLGMLCSLFAVSAVAAPADASAPADTITAAPDAVTGATPDAATEATPDAATEATPDAATEATPDAVTGATPDAATEATPDATTGATPEAAAETAAPAAEIPADAVHITLSSVENADGTFTNTATVDGQAAVEYDYTWHADPSVVHDEVKNCPAEYYTGTAPSGEEAVYVAHDIAYYPELPVEGFKKVNYDGEMEWVYYYPVEEYSGYIFANLPIQGSEVPTQMMHSEAEAYQNSVLHITKAGSYVLEGTWHGQIWIDLGDQDDTFTDPTAKVTLYLNNADVTCTVAPALVFYSVYECDNQWEENYEANGGATMDIDTSEAGANVVIVDGTENNFSGTNIYRMLKAKYKDEDSTDAVKVQKKVRKTDAAFYSYRSMNINGGALGDGVLNVTSGFEGLDTELHLSINGGHINIFSQDDGINTNEDYVSVTAINGGNLHILAGLGSEGDGVDSNGYLVVNGGTVVSMANPGSDSGLDADLGCYVNGGTVVALGSTMDWAESDSEAVTINLQFASSQSAGAAIVLTDEEGNLVFAYDPSSDEVAGTQIRTYTGAVISSPNFQVGDTYLLYLDGEVTGTDEQGVYDLATVTAYEGGTQMAYTGTDIARGPGGMPGGPGMGGEMGEMPVPPEGMGEMPEGMGGPGEMGEMPEGMGGPGGPGEMSEMPEGMGEGGPGMGGPGMMEGQNAEEGEASVSFYMSDKVNRFSGVTAADSVEIPAEGEQAPEAPAAALPFTDVTADDECYAAVAKLYAAGIMKGTSATTFAPDEAVTWAMGLTVASRVLGVDVPEVEGAWYAGVMAWASAYGVNVDPNTAPTVGEVVQLATLAATAAGQTIPAQVTALIATMDTTVTVTRAQLAQALAAFVG